MEMGHKITGVPVQNRLANLLIYAPVPLFQQDGQLYVQAQASNDLRLWAENFDRVLVMMPLENGAVPEGWVPLSQVGPVWARIEIHPLPSARRPDQFAREYRDTCSRIRALIDSANYLSFAISGQFGDWGAVACRQAQLKKRPYAVWTDRGESPGMPAETLGGSRKSGLTERLFHRPLAAMDRYVIRRAALGLFRGKDSFDAYGPLCANPFLVHDIHLAKADHIPRPVLRRKIEMVSDGPLQIAYAGGADAMTGPLDWIEALVQLDKSGVDFHATWLGDGDQLPRMEKEIKRSGLGDRVHLAGQCTDREQLLSVLRAAHLFMFCHKSLDAPRGLIEALASGTPIVGYCSAVPRDLIATHQGGLLVPKGDSKGLAEAVMQLDSDRKALGRMIANAALDGAPFEEASVFRHRSDVIKAVL